MNSISTVKQLLLMNNYYSLNKTLVKKLGLEDAFFLCLLADAEQLFKDKSEDGYFFQTVESIEESSGLSKYKQANITKRLEEKGLIESKLKGTPAKKHYRLNYENIEKLFIEEVEQTDDGEKNENHLTTRSQKISHLEVKKFDNKKSKNLTSIYKENNKENIYKENIYNNPPISPLRGDDEKTPKPYKEIIDYLNLKANTNFKPTVAQTKKSINARLNEGFTLDDFKEVIDKKCAEWKNTNMQKYLRPSTLFSQKFEVYLLQDNNNNNPYVKKEVHYDKSKTGLHL